MTICVQQSQQTQIPAILMVITEAILACVEDHQNNPDVISAWLANKTQAHLALWIAKNLSCTAMINRQVVGFSMASFTGEILLNYVHPKFHRQGIGTAMLAFLTHQLSTLNVKTLSLESTLTAKSFYLANGFVISKPLYEEEKLVG